MQCRGLEKAFVLNVDRCDAGTICLCAHPSEKTITYLAYDSPHRRRESTQFEFSIVCHSGI